MKLALFGLVCFVLAVQTASAASSMYPSPDLGVSGNTLNYYLPPFLTSILEVLFAPMNLQTDRPSSNPKPMNQQTGRPSSNPTPMNLQTSRPSSIGSISTGSIVLPKESYVPPTETAGTMALPAVLPSGFMFRSGSGTAKDPWVEAKEDPADQKTIIVVTKDGKSEAFKYDYECCDDFTFQNVGWGTRVKFTELNGNVVDRVFS
uniref:Uncharacterized protein n=1 Tax=Cacopsylla melanoneura TaxID=428564 RepID=A0A8D8TGQ8_9HEMI